MSLGAVLVFVSMVALQPLSIPSLVGLWDFSGIYDEPGGSVDVVDVRLNPSTSAPVVAHLDKEGISSADGSGRSCRWIRDLNVPTAPRGCIFTESDYEIPSLAVFDRRGNWLRIALDDNATRFGWIQKRNEFHTLAELLAGDKLTYLTTAWNGTLYDSAGLARPTRPVRTIDAIRQNGETPYRPVGRAFVQGRLWLHVEVLDQVCGDQDPQVVDTGWVPAQSPAGAQWAWFRSRGC